MTVDDLLALLCKQLDGKLRPTDTLRGNANGHLQIVRGEIYLGYIDTLSGDVRWAKEVRNG